MEDCELLHISRKRLMAVGGHTTSALAKPSCVAAVTIFRLAEVKT
jgi:hypothetical protein